VAYSTSSSTLTSSWLEFDSNFCGFLKSIDGGDVIGDVVDLGVGGIHKKHIGNIRYEDLVLAFGADMSKSLYEWIGATLNGTHTLKNGATSVADSKGRVTARAEFMNAQIREITFPALDASSKDAAAIEIKLAPEHMRAGTAGGTAAAKIQSKKQWSVSDFRLQIDGLDCTGVNAIDALTISIDLPSDLGFSREPQKQSTINIPNLAFTIPESAAASLIAWHEDFLIKGHHLEADEKSGSLQFLAANLQDVIFTLTFHHLGIFKLKKASADLGSIPRLRAEIYCEEIGLEYKNAPTFGAQPGSTNTFLGTAGTTQNVGRSPLSGVNVQGLSKMVGPITRQTQLSSLPASAPNLSWPLKFRT
jgi:hypothetical protein